MKDVIQAIEFYLNSSLDSIFIESLDQVKSIVKSDYLFCYPYNNKYCLGYSERGQYRKLYEFLNKQQCISFLLCDRLSLYLRKIDLYKEFKKKQYDLPCIDLCGYFNITDQFYSLFPKDRETPPPIFIRNEHEVEVLESVTQSNVNSYIINKGTYQFDSSKKTYIFALIIFCLWVYSNGFYDTYKIPYAKSKITI